MGQRPNTSISVYQDSNIRYCGVPRGCERIFILVGDGFVLGVMNGEIWDLVHDGEAYREKVMIR